MGTYDMNNQTKVTILSHSRGCLYKLWCLNQKSQKWKSKYILRWIRTAGVVGGAGSGIKQVLSGDVSILPIPGLPGLAVRKEQRRYVSNMLLLPTPTIWGNYSLIPTLIKSYSSIKYATLFENSTFRHGFQRYQLIAHLIANLNPPGVETIHLYGINKDTPTSFRYSSDNNFEEDLDTINENWADTVPLMSFQNAGLKWRDNNNGKVFYEKSILKFNEYTQNIIQLLQ